MSTDVCIKAVLIGTLSCSDLTWTCLAQYVCLQCSSLKESVTHLGIAKHDHPHQHRVYVHPQGLVMVNLIDLRSRAKTALITAFVGTYNSLNYL